MADAVHDTSTAPGALPDSAVTVGASGSQPPSCHGLLMSLSSSNTALLAALMEQRPLNSSWSRFNNR